MRTVLLTGASGYVASHLLAAAPSGVVAELRCQSRKPIPDAGTASGDTAVTWTQAEVLDPAACDALLSGVDVVVHLAAATGKVSARESFQANVRTTQKLLETCQTQGVGRFIYISSIAARYPLARYDHYARSKRMAEVAVEQSGVPHTIVRPTIVIGPGAAVYKSLERLARLPVVPVFGDGRVPVQPIWIGDLVARIWEIVQDSTAGDGVIELGGRDVLTIEDLIRRIARLVRGSEPRVAHLPAGLLRATLGTLECCLRPLLPLTAGQLAAFVNDGTARENALPARQQAGMMGIDEMLRLAAD